ncbi:MAG: hypothetical protein ACRDRX_12160 [Pseudonocardiaceae bacterium]
MDYTEENRSLYAAVTTDTQPSIDAVVRWTRYGLEHVLLPAVGERDYSLSMRVIRLNEDLRRPKALKGVVWDSIPCNEALENIAINGWPQQSGAEHAETQLLRVNANFPILRRRVNGTTGKTETIISLSVLKRALGSHCIDEVLQQRMVEWLLESFEELGGTTGYVTADFVQAGPGAYSPYESAVRFPSSERDFRRHLWGYYWGNLLGSEHVKLLGGPDAVQQAPVTIVRPVGSSSFYLQLTEDINDIDLDRLHQLREFLQPLLPEGSQPLEVHNRRPPYLL